MTMLPTKVKSKWAMGAKVKTKDDYSAHNLVTRINLARKGKCTTVIINFVGLSWELVARAMASQQENKNTCNSTTEVSYHQIINLGQWMTASTTKSQYKNGT